MKYVINFFLILLFLTSCSTPYQPRGLLGGYSEKNLSGNCYEVSYWGNQHSNADEIARYCLYRCAELTNEKGYKYFAILNKIEDCSKHSFSVGGSRQKLQGSSNNSANTKSNIRFTEYDYKYVIMMCDNEMDICNDIYYVPEVLEELSHYINN